MFILPHRRQHFRAAPPGGTDPYFANVVLLLHMDDTGLTDVKGHTSYPTGNVARSATQSKFGGFSAVYDGTGDDLSFADSTDWSLPGDLTIEAFVYTTTTAAGFGGIVSLVGEPTGPTMGLYRSGGNIVWHQDGSTRITSTAISTNTWYYVAAKRSGTTVSLHVEGVQQSTTYTSSTSFNPNTLSVGSSGGVASWTGYIDEVRITKGVARDVSSVPTAAFPDS